MKLRGRHAGSPLANPAEHRPPDPGATPNRYLRLVQWAARRYTEAGVLPTLDRGGPTASAWSGRLGPLPGLVTRVGPGQCLGPLPGARRRSPAP